MKLLKNTIAGYRYKHWTLNETIAYFFMGVARELNIAPIFFRDIFLKVALKNFKKKFSTTESHFDFNGALFPDISSDKDNFFSFAYAVFEDTFLIPCLYNNNHDKTVVEFLDKYLAEGPYGYKDDAFDVTIHKNDIVIDAGAWFGDFSAYASSLDAVTYAFEPVECNFQMLCKTAELNGEIYPVKKGLGSSECDMDIFICNTNSGAHSLVVEKGDSTLTEKIELTTLDQFVEENKLERVDFIKADIEGAERDMLKGATQTLKKFAPKLAICTYHLPDDPQVLEQIIMDANPNYKVVHLRHKLMAAVVK